jgi:transposase
MGDATTLLFGLDGFRVVSVSGRRGEGQDLERHVVVEGLEGEQACPDCGVLSASVHSRRQRRIKDVPHGRRPLRLWWDQRRWACRERGCGRRTFAEVSDQVGPGHRLTRRLREQLERAVSGSTRAAADVAREYGVSWWSVNAALIAKAASMTAPAPEGVRMLGVDETRARSVRWLLAEYGWRRTDQWMTSFVDLDPTHPGGLLGLAPGRSGASVRGWLDLQSQAFRDGIEVVAVDPSAPFAAALREVLPHATLVVDHWHLHRLANLMLTQVRQRVTQQVHGHRGRKANDSWAYRRLLLRGARHLSDKQWRRLTMLFTTDDPTGDPGRLGRQGAAAPAPGRAPGRRRAAGHRPPPRPCRLGPGGWSGAAAIRGPGPARPVLPPRRRGRRPRAHPPRGHDRDLVAGDRGLPATPGHQRSDRGLQPQDQADQACRLRLPQPELLRTAHHAEQRRRGVTSTVQSQPSRSTAKSRHP